VKSLILYYSHSGNTARMAQKFWNILKSKGESNLHELRYSDRKRNRIRHLLARFIPALASLENVPYEATDYDLLCIGAPAWGGRPAPLVCKYIKSLGNLPSARIIYFQIYGIKKSAKQSFSYVEKTLRHTGSKGLINVDISWNKARNEDNVEKVTTEALNKVLGE